MPNLFTVPPGHCVATLSVAHFMAQHTQAEWPHAVMLVPNRRGASVLRRAFLTALEGRSALLPRILPLAELGNELLSLLGAEALTLLDQVPPAMEEAQHRYLLASYVEAFERRRLGSATLAHSLALTDSLMELQERATRHGCTLTREALLPLLHADFAEHWRQSLEFLSILTDHWPEIERESGQTTIAAREVRLITLLAKHWRAQPAPYPVVAIGSTASQPATAALLQAIAEMPTGTVILPGLDPGINEGEWARIKPGHPYFHLKQFLDRWPVAPRAVTPLAQTTQNLWLEALASPEGIAAWRCPAQEHEKLNSLHSSPLGGEPARNPQTVENMPLNPCASVGGKNNAMLTELPPTKSHAESGIHKKWQNLCDLAPPQGGSYSACATKEVSPETGLLPALIPCTHGEEEVRAITLLLREGVEKPDAHVALITPDEGLMERVATSMQRYGVRVDRIRRGDLSATPGGSLWVALLDVLATPDRPLYMRALLQHPLLALPPELLAALEPGWRGVNRLARGCLPRVSDELLIHRGYKKSSALIQSLADLSTRRMTATEWLQACESALTEITQEPWGEAVEEALASLVHAERFGPLEVEDFVALARERLDTPARDIGLATHARIHLLTPVEARLQRFDRVVLAGMQDATWPGEAQVNPWLNLAAETALGLPAPGEQVSLIAHDLLMHGSAGEIFLTYARRDGQGPTPRSRFIEKLVAMLAVRGFTEAQLIRPEYVAWSAALSASAECVPEAPATPYPTAPERPKRLQVTDIEKLSSNPYAIYAKYVLRLTPLKDIDALPDASDFGNLAHKAIEQLEQHWNQLARPAEAMELEEIAQGALRNLSERPNIDLFWRTRLMNGLRFINRLEAARRVDLRAVASEQVREASLAETTLYGRIDRLEARAAGATIIDHKTGNAPSEKEILGGAAPQLLAYALILEALGQPVDAVEIWQLPKRGEEGEITRISREQFDLAAFKEQLSALLEAMRSPATPFLAKPFLGYGETLDDYDGISRYDEWAG